MSLLRRSRRTDVPDLSPHVAHQLQRARCLLAIDGTLDGLLAQLEVERRRPVVILNEPLDPRGPSGAWVETPDRDYIVVDSDATPTRRAAILAHEIAHIMLGHRGVAATTDPQRIAPSIDPDVAARFLARTHADSPDEHDAELLGTLLVVETQRSAPGRDFVDDRLR